ncbi:MAG: type IV toxin-antitoxin system AbiEi family antitoxin [Dermatophilaceae bacterium]
MEEMTAAVAQVFRDLGLTVHAPADGDEPSGLTVRVPTSDGTLHVYVDVRHRSQPLGPTELHKWADSARHPTVLAVPSVTRSQAARYRAAQVNFVDSGGNAHLDFPGFRVVVEGRKPTVHVKNGHDLPPILNAAGLKVAFVLLVRPDSASVSYDHLAQLALVSKGSVTGAMHNLRRRGHLFGEGSQRRVTNAARLADDWVDGYTRSLRPRLRSTELHGPDPDWWLASSTLLDDSSMAGGAALAHFGAPLRPDRTILFGTPPWKEARRAGRLSNDGPTNVILRERFWSKDVHGADSFAPRLLAYAEATSGGDPREDEAARRLWPDGAGSLVGG